MSLRNEIHEQPAVLSRVLRGQADPIRRIAAALEEQRVTASTWPPAEPPTTPGSTSSTSGALSTASPWPWPRRRCSPATSASRPSRTPSSSPSPSPASLRTSWGSWRRDVARGRRPWSSRTRSTRPWPGPPRHRRRLRGRGGGGGRDQDLHRAAHGHRHALGGHGRRGGTVARPGACPGGRVAGPRSGRHHPAKSRSATASWTAAWSWAAASTTPPPSSGPSS